jgi:DNA polymerase-3 subunit delta'
VPFKEIVGHARVVTLLSNAIARETLPPAMLFAGPAGVGKRRMAIAVAQALNCTARAAARPATGAGADACGTCSACVRIARGAHPDVLVVEPGDSGSIKIEQIRDVIDRSSYRPFEGRRRAVVVDHADAMGSEAQSALLKILEEPPPATIFILVTSAPDTLLPTVLSRCSRMRFGALSADEVARVLVRDHEYDEKDARAAAADADGSVGRAIDASSIDVAEARDVAQQILALAARVSDPSRRLSGVKGLVPSKMPLPAERAYLAACFRSMASLLRDLGILAGQADVRLLANVDLQGDLQRLTGTFDSRRSHRAFAAVDEALAALEKNVNPKVVTNWLVLQL